MTPQEMLGFKPGRDGKGRFAKGNSLGTGNPHAANVIRAKSALHKVIKDEVLEAITQRLVGIALESVDERAALDAIRLILAYVLGKPRTEIEITTTSTLSIEHRQRLVAEMLGIGPLPAQETDEPRTE